MRKTLSEKDIKDLRYQCRMGYILPSFLFIIGSVAGIVIAEYLFNNGSDSLNMKNVITVIMGFGLLAIFTSYKMIGKYISDIRNNEKILETKIIQKKESKKDYEAGSGNITTLPHNNPMKEFIRYDLIIENTKYRIDKELFEKCADGDEVYFHIAPRSKYRLGIELK